MRRDRLGRRHRDRQALIVVDEFSKLHNRPGAAVDLVRSFNVAVVLVAQAWVSLGPDDTIRNRLADPIGTVIAHPAQTARRNRRPRRYSYVVHPDDIRRLHQDEAFIIHSRQAVKVRVRSATRL